MDRTRLTGIALAVISAISFGSGGLFARPAYAAGIDWLTLMAWRFLIAGGLAWAILLAQPSARRALRGLPRRTLLFAMAMGVWYVSNTAAYYAGITAVPLSLAALIVYVYPPIVAVLAQRLGRPLQSRRAWVALGIAVTGVVLAVGGIDAATAPPLVPLLLIVSAPLTYAGWIILTARMGGERSDRLAHTADTGSSATVLGAIMLSTTGACYWVWTLGTGHPVLPDTIPAPAWPGILGVAVVAGFLATQGFNASSQRIGAAQAALVSTVEPLWTIIAAGILLGERLAPVQLLGGALILGGVLLSQTGSGSGEGAGAIPQPVVHLGED